MVYWQVPIHLSSAQISLINFYEYPLIQIKNSYFKIEILQRLILYFIQKF